MSFYSNVSRSPFGRTNTHALQTMGAYGADDPTWAHQYANDFDNYVATDWTVTVLNSTTRALTPGVGGRFLISNTTGAADLTYMQLATAGFAVNPCRDVFFKFKGQVDSAANTVFHAGMVIPSTNPVAATDGLFIHKPTGSGAIFLRSVIGGVTTSVAFPASSVILDGVDFEIGFHVTSSGDVEAFFNPTTGAPSYQPVAGTTLPGRVLTMMAPGLSTALLTPSFGILNSSAAVHTLNVDFVVVAQAR